MQNCGTANVFRFSDIEGTGTTAACDESTAVVSPSFRVLPGIAEQLRNMIIPDHNYEVKDETWFSTPERQRGEAEADQDIAEGRLARFSNVKDLIRDLRS
jgi:hypothetical protein